VEEMNFEKLVKEDNWSEIFDKLSDDDLIEFYKWAFDMDEFNARGMLITKDVINEFST
jgi:hypothetical protein